MLKCLLKQVVMYLFIHVIIVENFETKQKKRIGNLTNPA
jgi:hypothetical protein